MSQPNEQKAAQVVDLAGQSMPTGPDGLQVLTDPAPPTQVRHPTRALLRTAVQLLPVIAVMVSAIIETVKDVRPDWVAAWGPIAVAGSLILTRVMALSSVDQFLAIVGLSAAPAAGKHEA